MKVYKICIDGFYQCKQNEFIYKDLKKAKIFAINELKNTMKNIVNNNENSKNSEDRVYVFEEYEDKEIETLAFCSNGYYKSVTRVDNHIIEIINNFSEKLRYVYQIKYNILTEDEKYTDYTYSIEVEEFEVIE